MSYIFPAGLLSDLFDMKPVTVGTTEGGPLLQGTFHVMVERGNCALSVFLHGIASANRSDRPRYNVHLPVTQAMLAKVKMQPHSPIYLADWRAFAGKIRNARIPQLQDRARATGRRARLQVGANP